MKRVLGLGILLCLVSCTADTSDPSTMEDTAETQDALNVVSPPPIELVTAKEKEQEAVIARSLHGWRVYLRGQDYLDSPKGERHYYRLPRDVDRVSTLYLMRATDLYRRSQWIAFSMTRAWLEGDAYFEELAKTYRLTQFDKFGILLALADVGDEPPQISVLEAKMEGRYLRLEASEEGGPDPAWPQPPGNDHTGPGPGWGGGPSTSPPDLSGYHPGITHQPKPDPPSPYEKAKANWERAQKKKQMEDAARWYYGALPDEQGAVPAPSEVNYTPQPGEEKVNFRCGGVLVFGYSGECSDYTGQLSTRRALEALARGWWWRFPRWVEDKRDDAMRAIWDTAHHEVFNDGQGIDCKNECEGWSMSICAANIGMGLYLCRTHNPACAAALTQNPELLKDVGAVVATGVCYSRTSRNCLRNQCGSD